MKRKYFILSIPVLPAILTSCTSIVTESLEAAPDWFQERRVELRGEGYPDFSIVGNLAPSEEEIGWRSLEDSLLVARENVEANDPGPADITEEEMLAWGKEKQALVLKGEEPY